MSNQRKDRFCMNCGSKLRYHEQDVCDLCLGDVDFIEEGRHIQSSIDQDIKIKRSKSREAN